MTRAWVLSLVAVGGCGGEDARPADDGSTPGGGGVPGDTSAPWFREEALQRGLVFAHASGHAERHWMPEIACGGGALADLDMDGDLDAYLVQAGSLRAEPATRPPNRLYANDGAGMFLDVTAESGADDRGYGMGVAVGDVDEDGLPELFVTNYGPDALLFNAGALRFERRPERLVGDDGGWSSSATFVDHDRDGDLDLFVCRYLVWTPEAELECTNAGGARDYCGPKSYEAPAADRFFVNEAGTLREASHALGIDAARGNGLGVAATDFDADGWPDLFVANDGTADHLWRNLRGTRFEEVGRVVGVAADADGKYKAGMGVAVADVDGDEDFDLVVCNLGGEADSLHLNEGTWFREGTVRARLFTPTRPFTRFGMGLHDFDHDGRLDLYQANGRVERIASLHSDDPYAEPNSLLAGRGDFGFEPVAPAGGTDPPLVATSRAAAFGDVDGDGDVDVLVVNRDGPAHLLVNQVGAGRGTWLRLRVLERSGRDAYGARVTLRSGARRFSAEVRAGYSYLASNDPRVHFGLGAGAVVDAVEVVWPDGERQALGAPEPGREHVVRRR